MLFKFEQIGIEAARDFLYMSIKYVKEAGKGMRRSKRTGVGLGGGHNSAAVYQYTAG